MLGDECFDGSDHDPDGLRKREQQLCAAVRAFASKVPGAIHHHHMGDA
jgi:hypothetical protein